MDKNNIWLGPEKIPIKNLQMVKARDAFNNVINKLVKRTYYYFVQNICAYIQYKINIYKQNSIPNT